MVATSARVMLPFGSTSVSYTHLDVYKRQAFVCILLIVLQWLFPITYTSLGYLSPERVKHTLLLKQLSLIHI